MEATLRQGTYTTAVPCTQVARCGHMTLLRPQPQRAWPHLRKRAPTRTGPKRGGAGVLLKRAARSHVLAGRQGCGCGSNALPGMEGQVLVWLGHNVDAVGAVAPRQRHLLLSLQRYACGFNTTYQLHHTPGT